MFIVDNLREQKLFTEWMVLLFADYTCCKMACIRIPPFAFTLFDLSSSNKVPEWLGDITDLARVPWGEKPCIEFHLPVLKAANHSPLSWGNVG